MTRLSTSRLVAIAVAGTFLLCLLFLRAPAAEAQIFSPGKLSAPHTQLEGIANCTQCHQLGTRGISDQLCLSCHQPLARRIREGTGFHTAEASSGCAACHTEHFGKEFELIRFDTLSFEHRSIGYALDGAHLGVTCSACHTPALIADPEVRESLTPGGTVERTYLGLPTECVACHRSEDPHAGQFADRACTACHTTAGWDEAPLFEHEGTRYPLTGRHTSVDCVACHREVRPSAAGATFVRYAPLGFSECTACHQDQHEGAMAGSCTTCHNTAGWTGVDPTAVEGRFTHASTGFLLEGAHDRAACAACHDPARSGGEGLRLEFRAATLASAFPAPEAGECLACHIDVHEGALLDSPSGAVCTGCHGQEAWLPTSFGLNRHEMESRFTLEGAHVTVACEACHRGDDGILVLEPAFDACTACHQSDDPHGTQFAGRTCDSCHGTSSFQIPEFDHSQTAFPLEGGHQDVECVACHQADPGPSGESLVRYLPLGRACLDCHTERELR